MKVERIIIIMISIIWGAIGTLYAQDATAILSPSFPVTIPQTPEVIKLMGMINYPVSYNTGTVKTEIPLYEIKLNSGFTLPIKLVYQSSGFKPRERSNVGIGWTLVAEPQIAHAVNGLPDEDRNGLYANKGLNVNWSSVEHPFPAYVYVDMAYGRYDIEPDQYFYMLPHKGGSFFLNRHPAYNDRKEFVTVPYDPIKVEGLDNLKSFRLTDIDGVKYSFIPTEQTYTVTPDASWYTDAITMYKANSIVTPNHETIQFSYESEPHRYFLSNYEQSATLDIKSKESSSVQLRYCDGSGIFTNEVLNYKGENYGYQVKLTQHDVYGEDTKSTFFHVFDSDKTGKNNNIFEMCNYRGSNSWKQSISTKKINRISFPGGSVEFIYNKSGGINTLEKFLSGIIVRNNRGDVVKQYSLITEISGTDRPWLKEVQIMSNDRLSHRKYSFQYYNRLGIAYDSPKVNSWGYSQYQDNSNQTNIPQLHSKFALFSLSSGMVRDSISFCYGKEDYYQDASVDSDNNFMLKSVTYPTGGKTEFIYENGKFFESARKKEVATGCLRIKEMKNYQTDGTLSSQKMFKYGRKESGLGIPVRVLTDSDFMTSYWQDNYVKVGVFIPNWAYADRIFKVDIHARPVINDFLDASASIVYDEVTEYVDEKGRCGKTVYEYDYTNLEDIQSQRIIESYPLYPIMHKESLKKYREWSIGQLICRSVYDGNGVLMQREENLYTEKPGDQITRMLIYPHITNNFIDPMVRNWDTSRTLKAGYQPNPIDSKPFPAGIAENYQYDGRLSFNSGCKLLLSKIITNYEKGKVFSDTIRYIYNNQLLPATVVRTLDNGKTKKETFSYPTDFTDEISIAMVGMHILSPVIRHTITNGDAFYDVYNPYRLHSDTPVIDRIETGKEVDKREVRMRFTKYDSYGNLLEAEKDDGQQVSYIYGYHSLYPVAKMDGGGYDYITEEMGHLENYSDSTELANKCEVLRRSLKGNGLVTSYTFQPLVGVTSVTQPNGNKTSFGYNAFGELVSEADMNGKIEKQYGYNYKYNGNSSPLTVSFTTQSMYYLGTIDFSATASGGMGECKYQWFLTDGKNVNYQSGTSFSGTFRYEFTKTGTYQLKCRIEDTWGRSSTTTAEFQVEQNLRIRFENINYFSDGNERFMEADINCPVETNITFRLYYETDTWKGITFYINQQEFNRKGTGSDLVTVKFPKGSSRVYVVAPNTSPWYYLLMDTADAGVTFEYPFILTKQ